MADPVRVDVHMHLYPSAESGDWWKAGYEIWEYGEKGCGSAAPAGRSATRWRPWRRRASATASP